MNAMLFMKVRMCHLYLEASADSQQDHALLFKRAWCSCWLRC